MLGGESTPSLTAESTIVVDLGAQRLIIPLYIYSHLEISLNPASPLLAARPHRASVSLPMARKGNTGLGSEKLRLPEKWSPLVFHLGN